MAYNLLTRSRVNSLPRFVIAAPMSGSGKSTLTAGLIAALAQAHVVQPFKVGPDYIDPMYHTLASGRAAHNLDSWMLGHDDVTALFARASADAHIAVIEGVMGLYDGYEATTETGSTAEVAKLLNAPVILVLDASRMARSAGAIVLGFRDYDPDLTLAGVICNRVGSDQHAAWVTEAIEAVGVPVLGCIPRNPNLHLPERHLGLYTVAEREGEVQQFLTAAAKAVTTHVDLARVWDVAHSAGGLSAAPVPTKLPTPHVRLAVAHDEAFCFYYADNFDRLRAAGAEIAFFSPLRDKTLPADVAGLYLGGGYPELYARQLAANEPMRSAVREAIASGLPTYAECGGLMVLAESLTDADGQSHPMVGAVAGSTAMVGRMTLGYREVTATANNLLMQAGDSARGHEFHYSAWVDAPAQADAYHVTSRRSGQTYTEGIANGNLLASYIHLHFGSNPTLASNFVDACKAWADANLQAKHTQG